MAIKSNTIKRVLNKLCETHFNNYSLPVKRIRKINQLESSVFNYLLLLNFQFAKNQFVQKVDF